MNAKRASYRLFEVIERAAWFGILAHAGFVPVFYFLGVPSLAAFSVAGVAAWLGARWLNRQGLQDAAMMLLSVEVVAHAIAAVATLGWQSGFQYYLLPLIPFFTFNERASFFVSGAASLFVIATLAVLHVMFANDASSVDPFILEGLHTVNLTIPLVVLFVTGYYYRSASIAAEARLVLLASHDPLTGLLNRRRMLERLHERRAEFDRRERPFALVMADIDHFKAVNDAHGHEVGDQVLCDISQVLKANLREEDVLARWGGEEYLILLSEASLEAASVVAEKLRRAVETHPFGGGALSITMTFGVHVFDGALTLEQAIAAADSALYAGKAAGRNRVEFSGAEDRSTIR